MKQKAISNAVATLIIIKELPNMMTMTMATTPPMVLANTRSRSSINDFLTDGCMDETTEIAASETSFRPSKVGINNERKTAKLVLNVRAPILIVK